jgi:hypothetical protein
MSLLGETIQNIRKALELADKVESAGHTLKELSTELRDHDRRITRLEAQWETALAFSGRRRIE